MRKVVTFALLFWSCSAVLAQAPKPRVRVDNDGFPTGHDTAEGAAADLARAFMKSDVAIFAETCIKPYGGGKGREEYSKFLETTVQRMKQEAGKRDTSLQGPSRIGKVFAARHLTASGPASYGYASFGFQDVMFVDVGVFLRDGARALNRTLVIRDKDGKWYVHPAPALSPLISVGLNDEKASVQDFSEVYDIQK